MRVRVRLITGVAVILLLSLSVEAGDNSGWTSVTGQKDQSFKLVKSGVECNSKDDWLGKCSPSTSASCKLSSAEECAKKCIEKKNCAFFIFGTNSTKKGDCYVEHTDGKGCVEGWEKDWFDFYRAKAPWIGCTDKQALNYNSAATIDDGSCAEFNTCVEPAPFNTGTCDEWRKWCKQPCKPETGNLGYRNKENDTVKATRVAVGDITVDGDLQARRRRTADCAARCPRPGRG